MDTRSKVLLIDKDDKTYHILKNLLVTIDNFLLNFEIELITSKLNNIDLKKIIAQNYQIYLINTNLWLNNSQKKAQQLTILEQKLSPLTGQINPNRIILLTENYQLGRAALGLGIADYWEIDKIDEYLVERTLRFTLRNAAVAEQLKSNQTLYQSSIQSQSLQEKELQQQAAELQEWKNRYEAAIEASGQILYDWNSQNNQIIWSGNIEQILGYSDDEIGDNLEWWSQLIHPEDRAKFVVEIEGIRETREPLDLTYRVRRKDGSYIVVEDRGKFFIDSQDKLVRMVGFVRDITEKEKTEATIQQQEQQFKTLVENVPDLIIRLDKNNRYLYVNPVVEQASGITASEILGKTPQELGISQELATLWTQTHAKVFQTGEEQIIEYEYPSPGGTTYWMAQVVPELNREGKIETILVIGRNISQRKQVEESLQKSEEQLRLLMDSLPVCIAYTDREQRYQFINKNYEYWFGQKKEEISGKTIEEVLGEKAYEIVRHNVERALNGEPVTYETTLSYQNGRTRYVLGNLIPDVGEDAQIKGYYALITDISDRKQTEEKLRYRLVLETAITLVSKELATYERVDLKRILQILGIAVNANRVYLLRFYNNATKANMTHEWCDFSTVSKIEECQNVDLSSSPWWIKQLKQHKGVINASIDILFASSSDSAELVPHPNQSSSYTESLSYGIAIPIYNQFGKLWGQIGFDNTDNKSKVCPEEDSQLLRVVGDIIYRYHERINAQEKLQASESLYSSIFNHCADAIFLVKVLPDGEFVYETVNPAYEQTSGLFLEQIVGKTPREIFTVKNAIQTEQWYRTCVKLKETLFFEETLELPIGKRIWRTNLVPIADAQGKIITIQGSSRDITEERNAVDEQIRNAKYQRLLASLTIKIRQSLQIEEILQTAVSEIKTTLQADRVLFLKVSSQGTATVIHESVASGFSSLLNQVYNDKCLSRHYQTRHDFGQIKQCSNVATANLKPCYRELLQNAQIQSYLIFPIMIESSQESSTTILSGLLCVQQCSHPRQWTDYEIDLFKQIAAQLSIALKQAQLRQQEITQRQELARSNQDLEQFAYIVSHDLQEPLGIISSYGQLLKRHYQGQLEPIAEKYIDQMFKSMRRMRQQIDDLLQYSRVGTQKQTFQMIDCNWILKQAIENLEVTIKENKAIIRINTPFPTLMADGSQLIQLWQNLISNGIKYHGKLDPIIEINCQRKTEEWLFSVSDNGIGIEAQYQKRIFQIFQRLHTQEEYAGTGIGLSICQRIVQRHGGRIWVESTVGKGATFYFTIPEFNRILQEK